MNIIAKQIHILSRVYHLPTPNKLLMANYYQFRELNLLPQHQLIMPFFSLVVYQGLPKDCFYSKFIRSQTKRQEIEDSNTFLIYSLLSDLAIYRSKLLYDKRDGLEQLFRYLVYPNHTYVIQLNTTSYFVPQDLVFEQLLNGLEFLQLIDQNKLNKVLQQIQQKPILRINVQNSGKLVDILFPQFQMQEWRKIIQFNGIKNFHNLNYSSLGHQTNCLYFFKYHPNPKILYQDIIKLNKYLIEDFDMFQFRFKLEHNEKKMKIYFLRMIRAFHVQDQLLNQFLLISFKSYPLEWNKQFLKELKIALKYYIN